MSADVVIWPHPTRLDVPVERIVDGAKEANLQSIIVIGYDQEGDEYFAASMADGGEVLWLLERMKMHLLSVPEKMNEDAG